MDPQGDFVITKPDTAGRLGTVSAQRSEPRKLETIMETSRELDNFEVEDAMRSPKRTSQSFQSQNVRINPTNNHTITTTEIDEYVGEGEDADTKLLIEEKH